MIACHGLTGEDINRYVQHRKQYWYYANSGVVVRILMFSCYDNSFSRYEERTPIRYGGCRRCFEICDELFGVKQIKLSPEQTQQVVCVEKAEVKWEVDRVGKAVFIALTANEMSRLEWCVVSA